MEKHTNKVAIKILRETYSDYPENDWHYDREYKMIVRGIELSTLPEPEKCEGSIGGILSFTIQNPERQELINKFSKLSTEEMEKRLTNPPL